MRSPAPGCVPPNTVTPAARPVSRSPTLATGRVCTRSAALTCAMALPTSMRRWLPVAVETTGLSEMGSDVSRMSTVATWPATIVTAWRASPKPMRRTRTVTGPAVSPRMAYWPSAAVRAPAVVPTMLTWAEGTGWPVAASVTRPAIPPVVWAASGAAATSAASPPRSRRAKGRMRDMGWGKAVKGATRPKPPARARHGNPIVCHGCIGGTSSAGGIPTGRRGRSRGAVRLRPAPAPLSAAGSTPRKCDRARSGRAPTPARSRPPPALPAASSWCRWCWWPGTWCRRAGPARPWGAS